MNSYFFFGSHTFKYFSDTFMWQLGLLYSLNWVAWLTLKSYFYKSDRVLKSFLIGIFFNVIYKKILIKKIYYFCLISGR